jgi:exopolysaccharide production protein ExoZ
VIYNLQMLRAFAAISVVYLHVVSDAGLNLGIGAGNFGVDLFFVISGFTMSYVGHMPAGQFLLRRCIRILPLYWLATLGAFLIAWVAPTLIQSTSASVPHLLHSLIFLPYPNKLGDLRPTLALGWTLNYEMYFYSLFAVGLVFTVRFAPVVASALIVLSATVIRLVGAENRSLTFYADPIVYEFCFGVIVYYIVVAMSKIKPLPTHSTRARRGLLLTSTLAAISLPLLERLMLGDRTLWAGVPASILVLSVVLLEKKYEVAATDKRIVLLGDSSYVLYLLHPYILYGAIRLMLNPSTMGVPGLASWIIALMLVASLTAIGVHLVLERPTLSYLRGRFARKRPLPVPLTV